MRVINAEVDIYWEYGESWGHFPGDLNEVFRKQVPGMQSISKIFQF